MIRHGEAPFLECSSRGVKTLSAFHARVKRFGGKSIEEIYQSAKVFADGSTGLSCSEAKGRQATNMDEVHSLYSQLWDAYIAENPTLLEAITLASGLSDMFGQPGHCCQATELWRIRAEHMASKLKNNLLLNLGALSAKVVHLAETGLGLAVTYSDLTTSERKLVAWRLAFAPERSENAWCATSGAGGTLHANSAEALLELLGVEHIVAADLIEQSAAVGGHMGVAEHRQLCDKHGVAPQASPPSADCEFDPEDELVMAL